MIMQRQFRETGEVMPGLVILADQQVDKESRLLSRRKRERAVAHLDFDTKAFCGPLDMKETLGASTFLISGMV
jgi:hypothetical protein